MRELGRWWLLSSNWRDEQSSGEEQSRRGVGVAARKGEMKRERVD